MRRTSLSDYIRLQAVTAMLEKDAGAADFVRDLFKALKEMPSSMEEKVRIQQEIAKHPEYREDFKKLEEMAELMPTAKPFIKKMLAALSQSRYSGLGDIGRAIKEKVLPKKTSPAPSTETPTKKEPVRPQDLFTGKKPGEEKPAEATPKTTPAPPKEEDQTGLSDPANAKIKEAWTDKGVNISKITRKGSMAFVQGSLRKPIQPVTNGQKTDKSVWSLSLHPRGMVTIGVRSTAPRRREPVKASLADVMRELVARFDPTKKNVIDTLEEKKPGGELRFPAMRNFLDYLLNQEMKRDKVMRDVDEIKDSIEDSAIKKQMEMIGIRPTKVDQKGENYHINGKVFTDIDIIKKGKVIDPSIITLWVGEGGNVTAIMKFPELDKVMEEKIEEKIEEKTGEPPKPGAPKTPKPKGPDMRPMTEILKERRQKGFPAPAVAD